MALRQTMNLSQNLVITPQLQQAIKLLQLSRLELETQVRSELEENPILEEAEVLKEEDFQWYLDLRRYGSFPHSGFGLGIERTVAWICGLQHVRETIPFPMMLYRLRP